MSEPTRMTPLDLMSAGSRSAGEAVPAEAPVLALVDPESLFFVWSPQAVSSMVPATAMAPTAAMRVVAVVRRVERAVMFGFLRQVGTVRQAVMAHGVGCRRLV